MNEIRKLRERVDFLERKASEDRHTIELLRDSERRSRAWLEYSPACTKIVDLDFNLQYMSNAGVEDLHIEDIKSYYGKPYPFEFYPQSFRDQMTENLKRAKSTDKMISQEGSVVDIDGNELWYHSTLMPVKNEGQRDYITIVSIDITKRKLAEKTLQRVHDEMELRVKQRTIELTDNKEKLYRLLQNIQAAVVVHGPDTKIKDCNKKSQELLGLTRDQMLGKTTTDPSWKLYNENGDVLPQEDYPVNQVINSKIEVKNLIVGIYRPTKDDLIKVLINAIPSFDSEGNMVDIIVTFMDITKRMQTEEALQESDKKLKELNEELENKIKKRTTSLEDVNTALKVLLNKREEDKNQIGENINANFKSLVQPFLNQLRNVHTIDTQKDILDILESSIKEMITPFSREMSDPIIGLTPTEIQVADLVKAGKTNKEMSQILNKSIRAVSSHRDNIRKKLGLINKKINLRTYLLSLK